MTDHISADHAAARYDRLPTWARAELSNLRGRVAQLEAAAGVVDHPDAIGVYVYDVVQNAYRPMGANVSVRFQLHDPHANPNYGFGIAEASLSTQQSAEPRLNVRAVYGGLFIRPDSANSVHLDAPGTW